MGSNQDWRLVEQRESMIKEIAQRIRDMDTRIEQRETSDKEIAQRVRDIDARIEALYKWGGVGSSVDEEEDNDDCEWDLDDEMKAKIAECREGMKGGDPTSRHNLGVIFWNRAMNIYNARTADGYREAIRWLRKAAIVGYDCEDTLGAMPMSKCMTTTRRCSGIAEVSNAVEILYGFLREKSVTCIQRGRKSQRITLKP